MDRFAVTILLAVLFLALPAAGTTELRPSHDLITIKPGESNAGLMLHKDGRLYFYDELLGVLHDPRAAEVRLARSSPNKGLIYLLQYDFDWGGLQGSIIDPKNKKVVIKNIIPLDRVRGRGKAKSVIQIGLDISWSPLDRYAVTVERGEIIDHIFLLDLTAGRSHVIRVKDFTRNSCESQYFDTKNSYWINFFAYKLRVVLAENPWAISKCKKKKVYPFYDVLLNALTLELEL